MSNEVQKQMWMQLLASGAVIGLISGLVRFALTFFHFTQLQLYGGQFPLTFMMESLRIPMGLLIWILLSVFTIVILQIFNGGSDSVWIGGLNGLLLQSIWCIFILPLLGFSVWPNQYEWRTIVVEFCFSIGWGTWLSMTQHYLKDVFQKQA